MTTPQKKLDTITGCGLPLRHLLNTGMYGTAPVRIAAFLCPASKGMLGWTGNILNTCRSLTYAVFNIPALVLNSFEQEYVTMSTPPLAPFTDVHPLDLISRAQSQIKALNLLLTTQTGEALWMSDGLRDGLYFLFMGIENELAAATHMLSGEKQ